MIERAIIADDLTGALDAAAPFAMRGISTAVALDIAALPEAIATGARIIGVSTDSREIAPDAARDAVRAAMAQLPRGTPLFKKVDSRLKGNIAAELDAIPHARSLVVPAIPAFGRWVRQGRLGGFGVAEPINIAQVMGTHSGKAIVPDIEDQADITCALAGDFDLHIGARGLAETMARIMVSDTKAPDVSLPEARAFCVIGSTDPITLAQLERLREERPDLAYIAAPNGVASDDLPTPGPLTVIHAVPGTTKADGPSVARGLSAILARLAPPPDSFLILTGGATAQIILEQMGIRVLELVGEAQPGLPLARAGRYNVITKSGGFGDQAALVRLIDAYASPGEAGS